ncbi:MAG: bifunctional nicotinamidase/pyrazinamidase [Acidobacteriota bacterium]
MIDRRHDALLVIDVQPDFMPGGALPVEDGDLVVAPIAGLMPRFDIVVATQDWHPADHASFASQQGKAPFSTMELHGVTQVLWPDHCVQGSAGAELHRGLPREPLAMILRKGMHREVDSYSGFKENVGPGGSRPTTGLGAWLRARGVERVFVCGLARDYCVRFTAEDAAGEGFSTCVVDDLTRSVVPGSKPEVDAALAAHGVSLVRSSEL